MTGASRWLKPTLSNLPAPNDDDALNISFSDRNFWRDDDPALQLFLDALEWLDRTGEKTRLIALLLRTEYQLPHSAQFFLADFLGRYELRRPRGRQKIPAYDKSRTEALILAAIDHFKDLRANKIKRTDALTRAASTHGIPEDILDDAIKGKRGGSRRNRPKSRL